MADTDRLVKALGDLAPLAVAILALQQNVGAVSGLERQLTEAEGKRKIAEAAARQHSAAAEQARANVIEASKKAEDIIAQARSDAADLVAQARADATDQVEQIKSTQDAMLGSVNARIDEARATLDQLSTDIVAKTREHDAILASMQSLKQRLAG